MNLRDLVNNLNASEALIVPLEFIKVTPDKNSQRTFSI